VGKCCGKKRRRKKKKFYSSSGEGGLNFYLDIRQGGGLRPLGRIFWEKRGSLDDALSTPCGGGGEGSQCCPGVEKKNPRSRRGRTKSKDAENPLKMGGTV